MESKKIGKGCSAAKSTPYLPDDYLSVGRSIIHSHSLHIQGWGVNDIVVNLENAEVVISARQIMPFAGTLFISVAPGEALSKTL
ncbi:hypothetical protein ACI2L4_03255 [Streptomyces sparsogenes]|uniref:hypothetical protein n=1 Tax=Streptomyces sparsogenes TaxID=67365 RepID=UPI00340C7B19